MEVFWYCRYWFYVEIFITAGVHLSVSGHSHEYWSIGAIIKFFRNSIAFYTIVFNSCCFSRAENNKVKRKLYGWNESTKTEPIFIRANLFYLLLRITINLLHMKC